MQPERMREQVIDDLERIEATLKKAEAILRDLNYRDITDAEQAGAALYLANLYTAIESIALRLCKAHGVPVPQGASWHLDLLDLFSTGAQQVCRCYLMRGYSRTWTPTGSSATSFAMDTAWTSTGPKWCRCCRTRGQF